MVLEAIVERRGGSSPSMGTITDLGIVLNKQELETISSAVKQNPDLWTHESEYWGKDRISLPINFLGSPIYPAKARPGLYRKLRAKSEKFLIDNTSVLLQRTMYHLCSFYNCEFYQKLEDTSLPGFHVIHSITPTTVKYEYHQDRDYLEYYEDFGSRDKYNFNNFYSFTVAIELPKAGATVDFKLEEEFKYPYQVGHAYTWKSDIWHKIGDVVLQDANDYRITYQGHFIIQDNKILYYW